MVRRRGSTLAEMLVVLFVFSLMMVLILSFYIEGSRVTARQDKTSASYRQVLQVLDRVQTLLAYARVYEVQGDSIVFSQLSQREPLDSFGRPNWQAPSTLVAVLDERTERLQLVVREGTTTRLLQQLDRGDRVSFGWGGGPGSVVVTAISTSEIDARKREGEGVGRTLQVRRLILLENDGRF